MMAASLKDGDDIVDLLLARGADVTAKSMFCREKDNEQTWY